MFGIENWNDAFKMYSFVMASFLVLVALLWIIPPPFDIMFLGVVVLWIMMN